MRRLVLLAAIAAAGCGGVTPNTAPLTDEQKQKIKEEDRRIDDEEKSGSGTAVKAKKGR
ncbi:MAG TPA: hypothetical protein VMZ71_14145 [Gemmataceae bacterium]|nr:hypothetical protein [Gemmataceae bacterium]